MEEPGEHKLTAVDALRCTLQNDTNICSYPISALQFPTEADAISNITLHYEQSVPNSVIVTVKNTDNDGQVCWQHTMTPEKTCATLPIAYWTNKTPFITCACPDCVIDFAPAPSRISCTGIVYPSLVRYRLLSAPHSFILSRAERMIVTYQPFNRVHVKTADKLRHDTRKENYD